ncbi:MAG: DUF4139 domain-containing protein [Armatimonadetes bacterium]|nr:DUF4139 domain-containing protein [Armatimonadota bacterium]
MRCLVLTALTLCYATCYAADLVQLAGAGRTVLTLYPGQTRALVRETRQVTLPAGDSSLWFSWTTAKIDAATVALSVPNATVGEAVRPAGQDKTFVWRLSTASENTVTAVLTYMLDGCRWQPNYRLWIPAAGGPARLEGFLRLTNETGVDLAGVSVQAAVVGAGPEAVTQLYTLPEVCTVAQGETCTWPFVAAADVGSTVEYRYGADQYGGNVERVLRLSLDPETQRAVALLPAGSLTVYDAADDSAPLLLANLNFGGGYGMELDLGPEPDIVVHRKLMNMARSNIEQDRIGKVCGSDTQEDYEIQVRNHLTTPIDLRITELLTSNWELQSDLAPYEKGPTVARFALPVEPGAQAGLKFTLVKHSGTRVP